MRAGLLVVSSLAAVAFSVGPAFSADIVDSCANPWEGFYVGLHAGYAFGNGQTDIDDTDIEGFIGGGLAGYNYQPCGNIVIGLEGDIGFSPDIDGSDDALNDFDVEPNGHVRVRLGMDMDGAWMPFIAGGLAMADSDVIAGAPVDSRFHFGFSIGAGLDYRFTDNLVGRVEYLYDNYFEEEIAGPGGDIDFDTHTFRAALSWQF